MKNVLKIFMMIAVVVLAATSCKTKQKVTEITGANVPATSTTTVTTAPTNTEPATVAEPEVTRNETFTLSEGDAAAMKFKYHVVVGSFKNPTNAKGLQSTLVNEGNKALVVLNEAGWYRVIIASFNDYTVAHSKINQIRERFADAWVLVQK